MPHLRLRLAFCLVASSLPVLGQPQGSLVPTELRCEHRVDPEGLGVRQPRLSWELLAEDPAAVDLKQTAYEIRVAASPDSLARGQPLTWDSGQQSSALSSEIAFAGPALNSGGRYWWQVRVWDQKNQPSAWSPPARWTMGLLSPADWKAQWIGLELPSEVPAAALTEEQRTRLEAGKYMQLAGPTSRTGPLTSYFRRGFSVPADQKPIRVTFIYSPDQTCIVTLNGHDVGHAARWDPAPVLDLTSSIASGDNVIGLQVTQQDGYRPGVMGELELDFDGGRFVRLPVDATWKGSMTAAPGWDTPQGEDASWKPLTPFASGTPWHTGLNAFHPFRPAPYLRKTFTVGKPVQRATLYATALGLYEASVNQQRIGADYFTPGWTDYTRRVGTQSYDITAQVTPGRNVIQAILGDGWYAGIAAFTGKRHLYGGYARFAAQIELDYQDGTHDSIVTDGSWQGAAGPIRYADLLQGCALDDRRSPQEWQPVSVGLRSADGDAGKLASPAIEPTRIDPVRITEELKARSVAEPQPGVYVVDFGQNLVGWVRFHVHGNSGQQVTVRHGEMLNPDGTVYTSNLRGAAATDLYWLKGGDDEVLEPHFTFHGFRYVQITGLDAKPDAGSLTGIVVGTPLRRTGEFASSSPALNQLYSNIIWGQRGNYLEAPTDCPQRDERLGWTGDTQFFIPTAVYNYDVASFIERWTLAMRDGQGADGTFPDVAPATLRAGRAITAWGDSEIIVTHQLWSTYADTRVIADNFDAMNRYLEWLEVSSQKGVLTVGGYEDWLNQGDPTSTDLTDTAYGAYLAGLMNEMATAIGRSADAARYAGLQRKWTQGFRDTFVQPDGHLAKSGQTGFSLGFSMGLLPDGAKAAVAAQFVDDIAQRNWHLSTGFIGTPRLLPALHAAGRDDVAYRLLFQDTFPGWLFQVKEGATTMWERWDGWTPEHGFQTTDMNSFNHYSFGAVGEYLYRDVLGINSAAPGFRKLVLQPIPGNGLTAAKGAYDSPAGRIGSAWTIAQGAFNLTIDVPPNTTAHVVLPSGHTEEVGSGHRTFTEPYPSVTAPPASADAPGTAPRGP